MDLLKIDSGTPIPLSFNDALRYVSSRGWKTVTTIESSGEVLCTNVMPGILVDDETIILVKPSLAQTVDFVVGDWVEDRAILTHRIAFTVAMAKGAPNGSVAAHAAAACCFAAGYRVKSVTGKDRCAFSFSPKEIHPFVAPEVCAKIRQLQKDATKEAKDAEFLELKIKLGNALGDLRMVENITREFADEECLKRLLEKQAVRGLKSLLEADLDPGLCARHFRDLTGIWYQSPRQKFRKNELIRIYSLIRG